VRYFSLYILQRPQTASIWTDSRHEQSCISNRQIKTSLSQTSTSFCYGEVPRCRLLDRQIMSTWTKISTPEAARHEILYSMSLSTRQWKFYILILPSPRYLSYATLLPISIARPFTKSQLLSGEKALSTSSPNPPPEHFRGYAASAKFSLRFPCFTVLTSYSTSGVRGFLFLAQLPFFLVSY
jgi:hypothetical protein